MARCWVQKIFTFNIQIYKEKKKKIPILSKKVTSGARWSNHEERIPS
jgi:hypothetical protein